MNSVHLYSILIFTLGTCCQDRISADDAARLADRKGCMNCHRVSENHVGPAFQSIAAKYSTAPEDYRLLLVSADETDDVPAAKKSTVILAADNRDLRVRVVDSEGDEVVINDNNAKRLKPLMKNLNAKILSGTLSDNQRRNLIRDVFGTLGITRENRREQLISKLQNGGKGNWSHVTKGVPMPSYRRRLSAKEIETLVDWVMTPHSVKTIDVLKTGLGSGEVTSTPSGISCGDDCTNVFSGGSVTLTAVAAAGSVFKGWHGDASGTSPTVTIAMTEDRRVRAEFQLEKAIEPLPAALSPEVIAEYLAMHRSVNTPARFLKALPRDFRQNWILMSRSESLQTGTAKYPRILLCGEDARNVFTLGLSQHGSYPGSHPLAVEYMQWDGTTKNFRFHEIVLDRIPEMDPVIVNGSVEHTYPARTRGVAFDDQKCFSCHSTQNVINRSAFPGTTGLAPDNLRAKSKPNWDTYDSWGGMLPSNRDRIYQGSIEATAFRHLFNLWNWRGNTNEEVRRVLELLELQPPHVGPQSPHRIVRHPNEINDLAHIEFGFDGLPSIATTTAEVTYSFDESPTPAEDVLQGGRYVTLRHSNPIPTPANDDYQNPGSDEGRAVQLFDLLGGLDGSLNAERIADELIRHEVATGNTTIDVRPIVLAIARELLEIDNGTVRSTVPGAPMNVNLQFFEDRVGMSINALLADTQSRAQTVSPRKDRAESLTRRKADLQKLNLDRRNDNYLNSPPPAGENQKGLFLEYAQHSPSVSNIRSEVFRRPIDLGVGDATVIGGDYVDRELYYRNTPFLTMFRFFLEPLGASVDKWSMGVRGRSRTYTFADVFDEYLEVLKDEMERSLQSGPNPVPVTTDEEVIAAVNASLANLPSAAQVPTFTDIQRIFNKACIECHGALNYPPYRNFGRSVNFAEDESPAPGRTRLYRSHRRASLTSGRILRLLRKRSEDCTPVSVEMMPCGGPALSRTDIRTFERWRAGGRPFSVGDPHLQTVDGSTYDFAAAGEFVAFRDEGLELQVRQTPVPAAASQNKTEGPSVLSINTAIALRVGDHRVTYQPDLQGPKGEHGLQLRVDSKLVELAATAIPLSAGARIVPTIAPGGFQIESAGGEVIVVTPGWWKTYQVWYLNITSRKVRATRGLLGTVAPGNWLPALPDGTQSGPEPKSAELRHTLLYERFADAWRVTEEDSLFDYTPGTDTNTFTLRNWPRADDAEMLRDIRKMPGINLPDKLPVGIGTRVAVAQCRQIVDEGLKAKALKDVIATGDIGFAQTYRLIDQIENNSSPSVPELLFPRDNTVDLDREVNFSWKLSKDPDNDQLRYRHYVWPVESDPNTNEAHQLPPDAVVPAFETAFRKVPDLSSGVSYYWKVIVEDGKGRVTESETHKFRVR